MGNPTNNKLLLSKVMRIAQEKPDFGVLNDAFSLCRTIEAENLILVEKDTGVEKIYNKENFRYAHKIVKEIRRLSAIRLKENGDIRLANLNKRCLLFDAPYDFDAAIRYAEFDRPFERKFYEPRRTKLFPVVQALQSLADNRLELLSISLPPGVGKTTLAEMFVTWQGLKRPNDTILCGSHSISLLRGVYDEIDRMLSPLGEYGFRDIFPDVRFKKTFAKDLRIDLDTPKRFQTIQFSSIGSGNAGKVRCSNLLYCDDLIDGIETAMSNDRLEKLYQQYYTDLRQRKIGNCKELHIATRWSVRDPIGRLQELYANDKKARFISIPALNEKEESNFDYPLNLGFSTAFYIKQRDIMDDVSWKALYMNEPIEREGILYEETELRRYFELPDYEPDGIIGVCDSKTTGTDYCVLLIAYVYGGDYYIEDCVVENYAPDIVENSLVEKISKHNPHIVQFESNVAGGRLAQAVQEKIKERGCKTKITTKWTQANKVTKIQVNSPWVKEHCIFKDNTVIKSREFKEYRALIKFLTDYTLAGKNKHDDVPDALSQLAIMESNHITHNASIKNRPF